MSHMSIKDMNASYAPSLMGFVKQAMGTRRAQQLSITEADVGIIVLADFACTGSVKDHSSSLLSFVLVALIRCWAACPQCLPIHTISHSLDHVQDY